MTRVSLNDGTPTTPLSTEERQHEIIRELVEERDGLRTKLRASEAECARLTKRADELAADCLQVSREAFSLSQALSESQAEVAKLRREADDVRKLDDALVPDTEIIARRGLNDEVLIYLVSPGQERDDALLVSWCNWDPPAARRAAVEYLEKERKDG